MGELLPGSGRDPIAPGCSRQIKDWKALVITLQYKNRPGFIPRPDLPLLPLPAPLLPPHPRVSTRHPPGQRRSRAENSCRPSAGVSRVEGVRKEGEGVRDVAATTAERWHLAGTCKPCGWGRLGEELGHAQGRPRIPQGIMPGEGRAWRHQQSRCPVRRGPRL